MGEVPSVLATMCTKLKEANLVQTDAPSTFSEWGDAIRMQFDSDNLHLTGRATDTGTWQMIAQLKSLGRSVGGLHAQIASMQRELSSLHSAVQVAAPRTPGSMHGSRSPRIVAAASPRAAPTGPDAAPDAAPDATERGITDVNL